MARLTLILVALCAALSGCGADRHEQHSAVPRSTGLYISSTELARQLGNGFRGGLYRLAVMSQRGDDAKDLGQPLATGLVDRVRCGARQQRPTRGRWSWRCEVSWRTVTRVARRTRYVVDVAPAGCFDAHALPSRRPRYDATIRTFGQDPLDALGTGGRGC